MRRQKSERTVLWELQLGPVPGAQTLEQDRRYLLGHALECGFSLEGIGKVGEG